MMKIRVMVVVVIVIVIVIVPISFLIELNVVERGGERITVGETFTDKFSLLERVK
jgi:hypothetical protein